MGAVAGAIIPAVAGPVIGGLFGQSSANTQSQGAQQAAQTAANAQLQGLQFVQQQEAPYQQAGQQALGQYQNLLAGGAPSFDLSKLPGYQFQLQQGQQALENSAAARGQALSGNTIQATQQFGQGLASQQFQQYMSQLAGLANMGQAAASGVANQGANLLSGAGASLASGINNAAGYNAGATANWGNMFQQAFNAPSVQSGLGSLFSPSLPTGQQSLTDPTMFNNILTGGTSQYFGT
jgi:hypothetical protein